MLKSQPECRKKCDRVALSGNLALSGRFQVPKSPLRGKTAAGGQNGSCASTAERLVKLSYMEFVILGDGKPSRNQIGPLTRAMAKKIQEEEGSPNILLLWKEGPLSCEASPIHLSSIKTPQTLHHFIHPLHHHSLLVSSGLEPLPTRFQLGIGFHQVVSELRSSTHQELSYSSIFALHFYILLCFLFQLFQFLF
ncbi:hypothetical protein LR48_Vigan311s000200 [Vigna angularis]|uniref:Uncharacterized protein n=1 Tax=Phaseolus angularis TaxID=3914 RepID=A0A0L9T830_PHAAN|nr:hypothetical protein LR48_Vigan311s000200 [Vigna angularis]